jgi:hypothetical protein
MEAALSHQYIEPWAAGTGVTSPSCLPPQAKEARREREQQVAKAQMEAALSRGVSWGMGEDAAPGDGSSDEGEGGGNADVDWRAYAAAQSLTDKQAKLAQKVRKREARIGNLQREVDKIRVGAMVSYPIP